MLLVVAQVKIGAGVNTLNFLEAKWELELDIGGCIGVMRKLFMLMEPVLSIAETHGLVPAHPLIEPVLEPFHLLTGLNKKLHFHLFKFTHTKNELPGNNFVPEGLANLGNTKGDFHPAGFLDVQVVNEYPLGGLRTQVYGVCLIADGTQLGFKHQVKLPYVSPVTGARDGTGNFTILNYFFYRSQVIRFKRLHHSLVYGFGMFRQLNHTGVGLSEKLLIKTISKTLTRLFNLLFNFFLLLLNPLLNKRIGTVALLAVPVVNQRIVEGAGMPRCHPNLGVHENGRINPHNVLINPGHGFPPKATDVIL